MKTGNRLQPLTESEINEIQGISILTETDIENVSGGGNIPPDALRKIGSYIKDRVVEAGITWGFGAAWNLVTSMHINNDLSIAYTGNSFTDALNGGNLGA